MFFVVHERKSVSILYHYTFIEYYVSQYFYMRANTRLPDLVCKHSNRNYNHYYFYYRNPIKSTCVQKLLVSLIMSHTLVRCGCNAARIILIILCNCISIQILFFVILNTFRLRITLSILNAFRVLFSIIFIF